MSVLDGPMVFVDVETTGVSYHRGRVIEVAAIRVEAGQVTASFNSLIDPDTELPPFISQLTGITSRDLAGAPSFYNMAAELHSLMAGAVFVAHNVRFDYGFLKQEFGRAGLEFRPKLLCTLRLSRSLYPAARGHKLQNLIDRCGLRVDNRHRAYDDASAMWQFIQHSQAAFPAATLESAIAQQIKSPSLPKGLSPALVADLPESAGVYIFEDELGRPLYIGKSINLKKRVMTHFSADHKSDGEFKISQQISNIKTVTTAGELEALLLESALVKQQQPLYNRQLRRQQKLTLARQQLSGDGYIGVDISDVDKIDPAWIKDVLGVYQTKGRARHYILELVKTYGLCPKLMGLENGRGACFNYQLKKCAGACLGRETVSSYNTRLLLAFDKIRLQQWPYGSPVIIREQSDSEAVTSIIVDQWCVIASISEASDCDAQVKLHDKLFDLDTYKILRSFLSAKAHRLMVQPISYQQVDALTA